MIEERAILVLLVTWPVLGLWAAIERLLRRQREAEIERLRWALGRAIDMWGERANRG